MVIEGNESELITGEQSAVCTLSTYIYIYILNESLGLLWNKINLQSCILHITSVEIVVNSLLHKLKIRVSLQIHKTEMPLKMALKQLHLQKLYET